ncbi:MAG: pyrroline-5-carboxylate reductase [Deltaproteobacteria bacterium RBG_13_49_15]|nr:MAG: pyrroline-5-carboxylate reductase [Deltaproteobacteria bacterium RBG_13_49_15]
MLKLPFQIGLIGGGNMGEAFIAALTHSHTAEPPAIWVSDVDKRRLTRLQNAYGVNITNDNIELYLNCDIVVLAVKPQQMEKVLSQIASKPHGKSVKKKRIISIAAGVPIKKIERFLYAGLKESEKKRLPIIRVMPNTPALVLCGMSGMSANRHASADDIRIARKILGAIGHVIEFPERDLDSVTALSGSGPAYIFYFVESMIEAGSRIGLRPEDAKTLTLMTLKGAHALLENRHEGPEKLRRKVTSPGGTTEAALSILEKRRVKDTIIYAIEAAAKRAKELSR